MLIKGKPYVFFDLNAIIPRIDFYNFNVFATHEILHAIHYYLNPEFYQLNHRTIEEKYLKLLLSEGIATHLSHVITKDRKSTRLNSSHVAISYAVVCLKKKI